MMLGELIGSEYLTEQGNDYLTEAKSLYDAGSSNVLEGILMITTATDEAEAAELINSIGAKMALVKGTLSDPTALAESAIQQLPDLITGIWGAGGPPNPQDGTAAPVGDAEYNLETDSIANDTSDEEIDYGIGYGLDLFALEIGDESGLEYAIGAGASLSHPTLNEDGNYDVTLGISLNDSVGTELGPFFGSEFTGNVEGGHELSIDLVIDSHFGLIGTGEVKYTASTAAAVEAESGSFQPASEQVTSAAAFGSDIVNWIFDQTGTLLVDTLLDSDVASLLSSAPAGLTDWITENASSTDVVSGGVSFEYNLSGAHERGQDWLIAELLAAEVFGKASSHVLGTLVDLPALVGPRAAFAMINAGGIAAEGVANWASSALWENVDEDLVDVGSGTAYGVKVAGTSVVGQEDTLVPSLELSISESEGYAFIPWY